MAMETIRVDQLFFERLDDTPRVKRKPPKPVVAKAEVTPAPAETIPTKRRQQLRSGPNQFYNFIRPYFEKIWIFAWIILVIIASQIALYNKPIVGVYVTAAAFASLVGLGLWQVRARQIAISAAVLPVATMISLSLPQTTPFAQTVVFYDAILILGLVYRFIFTLDQPLTSTRLKLHGYIFTLPLMLVLGQLLGALGYIMLRHHYAFGHTSLPQVAAASVVFAISEEVVFRGLIQQRAAHVLHPITAAILSVILYTGFTFGHGSTYLAPLFGLVMGIALATTYYKKQNLLLTIAINASAKLAYVGLVAGFVFR